MSSNMKGIILSAAGFSSWALGDALIKYLTGFYSIYAIVFYNALFSSIIFMAVSPWLGGLRRTFQTKKMKLHLLRGLLFFVQMVMIIYGFSQMSLAKTYAIVFSAPFMAALLSIPLLKETIRPAQWLSIALGFGGILVILRPGIIPLDTATLSVMGGALAFAITNIAVRFIEKPGTHTETILSWGLLPELLITVCAGAMLLPHFVFPAAAHLPHMLGVALSSAFGIISISLAFRHAAPAVAAPFHYIQMLWGVVLGYLIFGDLLDIWTAMGGAIIIISGLWLIWQERNGNTKTPTAPPPSP